MGLVVVGLISFSDLGLGFGFLDLALVGFQVRLGSNRSVEIYDRVFPGIFGYFGYFWVCWVFSGISGFTHTYQGYLLTLMRAEKIATKPN